MERSDIATEVTLSPRSPQSALFNSQEATQRSCWGHCFKHLMKKSIIYRSSQWRLVLGHIYAQHLLRENKIRAIFVARKHKIAQN